MKKCRFGILLILLAVLLLMNLCIGSTSIRFGEVWRILVTGDHESASGAIIWTIRLPRLMTAASLGGALAVAGFLLQTFFGNPIAGPFVLGISSGAKLVVALVMITCISQGLAMGSGVMILAAFVGSLIAMGLILLIAGKVRQMSILIVCGIMIGYICTAVTDLAITFADESSIVNLHSWSMGSFSGSSWRDLAFILPVTLLALLASFLLSKPMTAYQMGEGYAESVGVKLKAFRIELILLSSLLSACVTAFAGPISFVGIAVPHLIRSLFKTSRPILMVPACFLGGSVFCLLCDLIARTAFAPRELSISTVTAIFGAPIVIWMMIQRQKRREQA